MPPSFIPLSRTLPFGSRVSGLKTGHLNDESLRLSLRKHWIEDGLIVFCDGEVTETFQIELSRVFGPLDFHPTSEFCGRGPPELITFSSAGEDRVEMEVDGELGEYQGWHKDLVYTDKINRGGILRALKPSRRGGITGFVDLIDAYERLARDVKRRIEDLRVVYQMTTYDQNPYATRSKIRMIRQSEAMRTLLKRRDTDFPPVSHPLVFTHPDIGRTVLNFSPGHARYVEGLPPSESHELLLALSDHVFGCPSYQHEWSTGEMLLWDNWRMLHMVSLIPRDEERIMQRTTIAGDYGLGRRLPAK